MYLERYNLLRMSKDIDYYILTIISYHDTINCANFCTINSMTTSVQLSDKNFRLNKFGI